MENTTNPSTRTEIRVPLMGLPEEPTLHIVRKALFFAAEAHRKSDNPVSKNMAKKFEEAGRQAKLV